MRPQRYKDLTAAEIDRIGRVPFHGGPSGTPGRIAYHSNVMIESHRGLLHRAPEARLHLQNGLKTAYLNAMKSKCLFEHRGDRRPERKTPWISGGGRSRLSNCSS